jgi:phospholipase C
VARGPSLAADSPWGLLGVVAVAVALTLVSATLAPVPVMARMGAVLPPGPPPATFPISHVVIVMMENHAYDSLFGAYCNANNASQATAAACNAPGTNGGLADGTPPHAWSLGVPLNLSDPSRGSARAFFWSPANLSGLQNCAHQWNNSHVALDGGRMDGFPTSCGGSTAPMGEYNGTTVPTYWDLAQEFGLGDAVFSSVLAYSLGNHWYLLAGNAPSAGFVCCLSNQTKAVHRAYLDQANATPTVEQLIGEHNPLLSWEYYDWSLLPYPDAIRTGLTESFAIGSAYNIWNPLAAKHQSYQAATPNHFADRYAFFSDLAAGRLPSVSWIIPSVNQSDHPPANITQGERLVQQVVDAVEGSAYWGSTAVFVTWDDFGGFYDHVVPPQILAGNQVTGNTTVGLSFRSALLVVSPFTPRGLVVHTPLDFESLLAFVEWRFGLGCLTPRDCAELRAIAAGGGPLAFFPLIGTGQTRPPVYIDPPSNATYPVPDVPPPAVPYRAPPTAESAADGD